MPVLSTIAVATAGGALAGFAAKKIISNNSKGGSEGSAMPAPAPIPQAPTVESATAKAEDVVKKKKAAGSKSVYTSPLGAAGEAQVARKTLLGQ